jgi:hypothetical protein
VLTSLLLALALAADPALADTAAPPPGTSPASPPAPPPVPPPQPPLDLAALQARADELKLARDPGWLRLGHWRPRWLPGVKGDPDGPEFYLAPEGKTDPAAELRATLAGLLAPPPGGDDELADPACRFPARLSFLADRLGLDPGRLPMRSCPRQLAFSEQVRARSVTLVFSSYYLNNPASAFGHTFLRLNKGEEARAGRSAELLDFGVNYAAVPDTGNALLYAVKGLFGLFRAGFSHYPYYYKVREYADSESRDLWEYDLSLTPSETALLVAHLWELGGTWMDYWYVDENCSYHVLGALQAAAPRLTLIDPFAWRPLVVPADTVKVLFENPGLVRGVHYRPAMRTQFEARARGLDGAQASAVEALAHDPAAPLPAGDALVQARVLDAALDLMDVRHAKALLFDASPALARDRQVLLERRSAIRVQSPELVITPPEESRPDRGHGSLRLGLGGGLLEPGGAARGGFANLDVRLSLHDLLDPPEGYPPEAQIEFLPLRLRYDGVRERVELDQGDLVRIVSLAPWDRFSRRTSWHLRVGAETIRDAGCASCLAFATGGGAGFAGAGLGEALHVAAFADVSVEAAPHLDGIGGSGWRVGLGPAALLRLRAGSRAALLLSGDWRWLPGTPTHETWTLSGAGRLHLGRSASLALEYRRRPTEQALGLTLYLFDSL